MSEPSSRTIAVTLSLPPTLEERMIDWLLARDDVPAFTGYTTYAHGSAAGRALSVAEQVSGRQRRLELRVELASAALEAWLASLAVDFAGADIGYLVTPVLRSGRLEALVGTAAHDPVDSSAATVTR